MATFGKKKVDKSKTVTEQQSDGSVLYFYYDKNSNYLGYSPETFDNLQVAKSPRATKKIPYPQSKNQSQIRGFKYDYKIF